MSRKKIAALKADILRLKAEGLTLRQIAVFMKLPYRDVRKFYKEGF